MGVFKLFFFVILFSSLTTANGFTASNKKSTENKNRTDITSLFNKSNNGETKKRILSNKTQATKKSAYNLSERTINPNSPMCQYAKKNDIIALKKALLKSNYSIGEINTICKNNESLFLIAVNNDNYLTAKFLLEKGADVNLQNKAGVSALHIISRCNTANMNKIFNLMLKNTRLNINIKDLEGYTPLMRAIEFENIQIVKTLVKNGADLNVKNNYGHNAMELAQLSLEGKKTDENRAISNKIIDILNNNE